jgi:PiT family inorganic phosphate transporter
MPRMDPALLAAAVLFAAVCGANDGASLLGANLSSKAIRPLAAVALVALAIVVGPFLLGTAVATTLAVRLVSFGAGPAGSGALLLAVCCAMGLMAVLGRLGIPSSVTQALTGAIIGIGIGRGLPVDASAVGRVAIVLVAAPIAAGIASAAVASVIGRTRPRATLPRHLRRLHMLSFTAQLAAYAANDAGKMTALMAVAAGTVTAAGVTTTLPAQALIALAFAAGTLAGAARLGGRLGKLLRISPVHAISAGFAASGAVLASAAMGFPVSMAQANASALVGAQAAIGSWRSIRVEQALRILFTWATTLPAAAAVAAIAGFMTR